jgi:hypothetical protein
MLDWKHRGVPNLGNPWENAVKSAKQHTIPDVAFMMASLGVSKHFISSSLASLHIHKTVNMCEITKNLYLPRVSFSAIYPNSASLQ